MDFIQGEKFKDLANDIDTFYCHTHHLPNFLKLMEGHAPYYLITHNSDRGANIQVPDNVIKWYAQNVNIKDPKIESIPIGIENNEWLAKTCKMGILLDTMKSPALPISNVAYMNHNIATNIRERERLYPMFSDKPWVTIKKGRNGKDFSDYIQNVRHHLFTFCPEGNGIDTHRTWEVLYMGRIPIEKRNINNQYYTDLPICFVDSWEEVTLEFLSQELERIKTGLWNFDKLTFNYWKNKIQNHE